MQSAQKAKIAAPAAQRQHQDDMVRVDLSAVVMRIAGMFLLAATLVAGLVAEISNQRYALFSATGQSQSLADRR